MLNATDRAVRLESICFGYRGSPSEDLFRDFDLEVETGSVVALVGRSGVGKSTLGRILTGMMKVRSGRVRWNQEIEPPLHRVYSDQDPFNGIFPWQRVRRNLTYPLQKLGWQSDIVRQRVEELLDAFGLENLQESYPAELSGGELQRLALARCMTWKPKLLVLDESLSALDTTTRLRVITALRTTFRSNGTTAVMITHNLEDACSLADRLIILQGKPVQVAMDSTVPPEDRTNPAMLTELKTRALQAVGYEVVS